MGEQRESWSEVFQSLSEAVIGVLKAELEVLGEQWQKWGSRMGLVAGLFGVAVVLIVSALLLMPFFLTALVHYLTGWSWAGSSALIVGLILLLASAVGGFGYLKMKRLDNPIAMTRERFDDHLGWWRSDVVSGVVEVESDPLGGAENDSE